MHHRIQQEAARLYPHAELVDHAQWPLPLAACYIDADEWLCPHETHYGTLNHQRPFGSPWLNRRRRSFDHDGMVYSAGTEQA